MAAQRRYLLYMRTRLDGEPNERQLPGHTGYYISLVESQVS